MQTRDYVDGLNEIATLLGIDLVIETLSEIESGEYQVEYYRDSIRRTVSSVMRSRSAIERDPRLAPIAEAYGIDKIFSDENLFDLMEVLSVSSHRVGEPDVWRQLKRVLIYAETFRMMVQGTNELLRKVGTDSSGAVFVVRIVDYDGKGVEPERLALIVKTVGALYAQIAEVFGVNSELRIAFLDSGSDEGIGFSGDPKVVTYVARLIVDVFGVFRFWRNDRIERDNRTRFMGAKQMAELYAAAGKPIPEGKLEEQAVAIERNLRTLDKSGVYPDSDNKSVQPVRDQLASGKAQGLLTSGDSQSPPKQTGPGEIDLD